MWFGNFCREKLFLAVRIALKNTVLLETLSHVRSSRRRLKPGCSSATPPSMKKWVRALLVRSSVVSKIRSLRKTSFPR
jgi:hypothetical protein